MWDAARDRLVASDPGARRLRLACSAILAVGIAVVALLPFGPGTPVLLVGAIGAAVTTFTVHDTTPPQQAVTLALSVVAGGCALTAASAGSAAGPLDGIVFVSLIFVAVYAQRFGPRGLALGSISFILFFFAMFLRTQVAQVPQLLAAFGTGVAANAIVRFALLPRRPAAELLRLRRAVRGRLGAVARAAANHLASGTEHSKARLRRSNTRLHECVLLVEDTADDVVDERAVAAFRRRAIELELAVQWLSSTTERTCAEDLPPAVRADLVAALREFRALIERDPRELPMISDSAEFSKLLVGGSSLGERPQPGGELRRALAELALADVNAQRIAERDYSAEPLETGDDADTTDAPEEERTKVFAFDNQTRSAIQALIGGGLAVAGGELVSPQRWYWAVLTVFVVFLGTSTAGATLVKGARRVAGTFVGIAGGVLATLLAGGLLPLTIAMIVLCVFAMVYIARVSQTIMAFFITTMLGLIYSLLGTFSFAVLGLRLAETAVGALAGLLAAVIFVPVRTRAVMLDDVAEVLRQLSDFLEAAGELLSGRENVNVIELSRQLDRAVDKVRTTVEPLTHPINVSSARRDYGWHVVTTLDSVAFHVRRIAARAQAGLLATDERLDARITRIAGNVDVLLEAAKQPSMGTDRTLTRGQDAPPGDIADEARTRWLLSSFGQLDSALIALGRAFDVDSSGSPPELDRSSAA